MRRSPRVKGSEGPGKKRFTWGGARPGAGRKRTSDRQLEPHRARPEHQKRHPVLVTLRSRLNTLGSDALRSVIARAVEGAAGWDPESFHILGHAVSSDEVHLIVRADDTHNLSGGMRSVTIRIARSVNAALARTGRFWADRWHGRELSSRRERDDALGRILGKRRTRVKRAAR